MFKRPTRFIIGRKLLATTLITSLLCSQFATSSPQEVEQPLEKGQIIPQIYQLVDDRNPVSPVFSQALNSNKKELVFTALTGLGRIGGKTVIPLITPFLSHQEESYRRHAAFALGLTANKEAGPHLWKRLELESSELVKHEIYLGLGNLGQNGLVTNALKRLEKEKSANVRASLFQGLGIAMVFHRDLKDDYDDIDFDDLLELFAVGDDNAARVGFFIDRVPGIEKLIDSDDILPLTRKKMSPLSAIYLTRLIGKISKEDSSNNREILSWLIAQSDNGSQGEQIEALRGMRNMMKYPQSLVQLGKMQASSNLILAQTALNVLANSDNNSRNLVSLLKSKLKSPHDALVVEAMRGLIKRQNKDKMSWVMNFFRHKSAYVKIQLMGLLHEKSKEEFNNFIKFLSQDPNPRVSTQAKRLLAGVEEEKEIRASSPTYSEVKKIIGKVVTLKTSVGDISFELLPDAPYTAWHFVNNAQRGVFDNNYFSRVIGNFVAQGGDTIGDRTGSSGEMIREEINFLKSEPMTVAMATAGKDTGTSQFYFNTARNLHLDRNYTIFARVISGYENVLNMTNGTIIYQVIIK
jgi:cyclophilin family peptidyl-prolyl cis-trans isomerase/HEAT repeat protein